MHLGSMAGRVVVDEASESSSSRSESFSNSLPPKARLTELGSVHSYWGRLTAEMRKGSRQG